MAKKTFKNNLHATDAIMHGDVDEVTDDMLNSMSFGRKRKQASAITPRANGVKELHGWQMTPVGLIPPDDFDEENYSAFGRDLMRLDTSMQWMLGDYINIGDQRQWGETYSALAEEFNYKESTLRQYAYVARKVNLSIRIDKLQFSHHQVVASMTPDEQSEWLQFAAENDLKVAALRKEIKLAQLPPPEPDSEPDEPHTHFGWIAGNFAYHKDYGTGIVEEVLNEKFVRVRFEDGTTQDLSEDWIERDAKAEAAHAAMGGDSLPSRVEPEPVQLPLWDAFRTQQSDKLERMTPDELRTLRNEMIDFAAYIQQVEQYRARGS